jgi:hypothetical protein
MPQAGRSRIRLPMGVIDFFFNAPNPSMRTLAPEFTQSVTEMSTGRFLGVKRDRRAMLTS